MVAITSWTALRRAAIAADRTRARRQRRDAIDLWEGIVAGRCSLIDHFDMEGRRFLIVRRNANEQPAGVSARERQVLGYRALGYALKLIAHELGLSIATVAKDLDRAMKTLGLHADSELTGLVADDEPLPKKK